jgi:predicted nucleic acid-binding protein
MAICDSFHWRCVKKERALNKKAVLSRVIRIGTRLIKTTSETKSGRALSFVNKMILMAGPHASCQILRQNIQQLLFIGSQRTLVSPQLRNK